MSDVKQSKSQGSIIEIFIAPGNADAEDLAELYNALSDLHRSCGGAGVVFRDDKDSIYISEHEKPKLPRGPYEVVE